MRILVTGGAGLIGSALVRHLIENSEHEVPNFDKLTYAGTLLTVERVASSNRYRFVQAGICDAEAVRAALADFRPNVVAHLAAESHVDRTNDGPGAFVQTNIVDTFTMLTEARAYWSALDEEAAALAAACGSAGIPLIQVSTDHVSRATRRAHGRSTIPSPARRLWRLQAWGTSWRCGPAAHAMRSSDPPGW